MSTIFSTGDVVVWHIGDPTLPSYVGVVENAYETSLGDRVVVRFWSKNRSCFCEKAEDHGVQLLTKIGNIDDWDCGIF